MSKAEDRQSTLLYPSNLTSTGNARFSYFEAIKFSRDKKEQEDTPTILGAVALPMPANLSDIYTHAFADDAEGMFAAGLADALSGIDDAGKQALEGVVKGGAFNGIKYATWALMGQMNEGGVRTAASVLGKNLPDGAANVNPFLRNAYVGTTFKQHLFRYNMIARNSSESETIRRIVNFFRFHAAPNAGVTGDNFFIGNPHRFKIFFMNEIAKDQFDQNRYLHRPGICVLTAMDVTYNGSGNPVFFRNTGAPVEVSITLQFKEDTLKYNADLIATYDDTGFGSTESGTAISTGG